MSVVLIVDDSLTVRMDLAEACEAAGLSPRLASTIAEARAALGGLDVALVILDVILPDGDGIELMTEIRANAATAKTPILLLSSHAHVQDRIRGIQTGADDYVGKPYDAGYVVARARELIRAQEGPPAGDKLQVLVIDDSPTFREALRTSLERVGYAVLSASNGEEGLRIAAASRPAAIIVDGVMPGIDGATVIRRIRLDAVLRGVPCVLLTGSDDMRAELAALDAGADAFARKEEDLEVVLARLAAALRGASSVRLSGASLLGPKRILAVDDDAAFLAALSANLEDEGYDVVLATSGKEALEMLAVQVVDCILLDLTLPGLDGLETCRRIKASPAAREIPLVMMTAHEGRETMLECLANGADDFVPKSSELEVQKARVRAQLRRKQLEDEHRRIREELMRSELVAAEARAARKLADAKEALVEELERKNKELEAFSYSVSHDLRAPLRTIDGFGKILLEDYNDKLDETGRHHLARICAGARRMGELIDDLLKLSRVSRGELARRPVNLSDMAHEVLEELQRREPERRVLRVV
ncbi:MAG TPA: response regulator, partial [Polyangiaceae bacterium]|nr:response regulator [Polyangiaceae bacterium]